jgi:hypothetical protein
MIATAAGPKGRPSQFLRQVQSIPARFVNVSQRDQNAAQEAQRRRFAN